MKICQEKIEKIYSKYGFNSKQFSKLTKTSNLSNLNEIIQFLLSQNLSDKPEIVDYLKTYQSSTFITIIAKMDNNLPNEIKKTIYLNVVEINPNLTELIFRTIYDGGVTFRRYMLRDNRLHFSFSELKKFNLSQLSSTDISYLLVDLALDKKEFYDLPEQSVSSNQPLNDLKLIAKTIKPSVDFYVLNLVSAIINNSHLDNSLLIMVFDILNYDKKEIINIYIQAYENSAFNFLEMLLEQFPYLPKSLYIEYVINAKKDKALPTFVKYAKQLSEQTNKELLAIIKNNYKRSQVKQIKEVLINDKIFDEETTQKFIEDFDFCQRIVDINTPKQKIDED